MDMTSPTLNRAGFDAVLDDAYAVFEARRPRLDALARHRRLVLYSYGARGRDVAAQLRGQGVDCVIFDNAADALARAAQDGFETTAALPSGLPVVVVAGQNQIEILGQLGPDAHSLADVLHAFDLRTSYGPARDCTAMTRTRRDDLYQRWLSLELGSRAPFLEVLQFRASLDVHHLASRRPMRESWIAPVPLDVRSFCDVGAYDGDTLEVIKQAYPALERTLTIEPNPALAAPIAHAARRLGLANTHFAGAAWSRKARLGAQALPNRMLVIREAADGDVEAEALDVLAAGQTYDLVKFDVEGAEAQALEGAQALLRRARCLAVAAYHFPDDLVDVPAKLEALLGEGWRYHFRHYSQSFDDSVIYACRGMFNRATAGEEACVQGSRPPPGRSR